MELRFKCDYGDHPLADAFRKIDDLRERGLRLYEAAAHASVDHQTGDWRELLDAYCSFRPDAKYGR